MNIVLDSNRNKKTVKSLKHYTEIDTNGSHKILSESNGSLWMFVPTDNKNTLYPMKIEEKEKE